MLNASGRPKTHIAPIGFHVPHQLDCCLAVLFDFYFAFFVAMLHRERLLVSDIAFCCNGIIHGIGIIGRLDDENGGFEVLKVVDNVEAINE
jgi:hypothetical protein